MQEAADHHERHAGKHAEDSSAHFTHLLCIVGHTGDEMAGLQLVEIAIG